MIYRILRWALYAICVLLIILTGAIGFIQTAPGKRLLESKLSAYLSTEETGIQVSNLEGWVPLDMRIGALQLSDRDGAWLKAHNVRLDWSPSALIGRHVQVDEISAGRVEIRRMPAGDANPEPASDEPFRLPEIPASFPPITVEQFAMPEIVLAPSVLGEPASFALDGSLLPGDGGDKVIAKLCLERTDQATAFATLDATAGLAAETLDLVFKASESGGVINRLAGRSEIGNVDLALEGKGPLDDWSGRLLADVAGLGHADAEIGLAFLDQPRLTIDSRIEPAPGALPDDLAPLIGSQLSIDLDLIQTKAQAIQLKKASITNVLAMLGAEGSADFAHGQISLQSRLEASDLAPLSGLANAELGGALKANLDVGGTLDAPEGLFDLSISNPTIDDQGARSVKTALRWTTTTPLSSGQPAVDVTIDGNAEGLSIPDLPLPDPDSAWSARLAVPFEGDITIDQAKIETAGATLSASGTLDPASIDGLIDFTLDAPSLQRLAKPYGQPIDGKAQIEATVRLADQAETIAVDLDATLDHLEGLPEGASELIGETAKVEVNLTHDPSGMLDIENLTVNGANVALDGDASISLDQETIAGNLEAVLPDLAVLAPLVPSGIEGAVDLDVDLSGQFAAPAADLKLSTRDLVLAGEPISSLSLTLAGKNLAAAPNGDVKVDITARDTPATLALAYRMADDVLNLDDIRLNAPETEIGGDLSVLLQTALIEGKVTGQIADLDALEPWLQQKLGGSLDLKATLAADGDRQNADLVLGGQNVSGDFGAVQTVNAEAALSDVTKQRNVEATVTLAGFEQGANKIDELSLNASGNEGALDFDLGVKGEVVKALALNAKGAARFSEGFGLGVESLNGVFAGEPLRLAGPLALQQAEDSIWLSDLDLRLGTASLKGDVEIHEETVLGEIDLTGLPLRWSEVFGGPSMTGVASADIEMSGSITDPKVAAALTINGELSENVARSALPLDIKLSTLLDQGQLAANLEGEGFGERPIKASVSLPARLALLPFAFEVPEDGALDGRIDTELQLARLTEIFEIDDQKLQGDLVADITIGGTLGEPALNGPVTLQGGSYENGISGTDLRDLNIKALASSERIDLENLSASTGKRGVIASNGHLALDAEAAFPLSVSLRLDQALLVDRDDAEARISGSIAMTGDLDDAEVEGDLKVDRAEIFLPEGDAPNLPEIRVIERNGRFVNLEEDEAETTEARAFDPALNLGLAMPNKVYVRGRGLESEWQGNLRINGSASNPSIVGSINVKEGYFDFLEKRFELERGEITFSGGTPPNPIITIRAVAEDDGFKAIVRLSGPADDPQLLLSSEPALPDDEVLSRLLFNRPLDEIGAIEAGKLALAVNKLRSSGGGFDAFGEIRNILKIDTLDVVSGEDGDSRVKAGKYLSDDVYVEVEKGAGDQSGRARVEIELLPNLSLEADTSEDANSGVGIKWKFNY